MRYTRYDYKKKGGGGFFLWILLIIILAVAIGITIFKMFFSEGEISNSLKVPNKSQQEESINTAENSSIFKIIQCGLFSKEENANSTLTTLPSSMTGFVIQEDGKFKVMAGIYKEEESAKKTEELTKASINNFTIKCCIPKDSSEKKIEAQIIEGYLQIINKFEESDVKSVKTVDFKKWTEETVANIKSPSEEVQNLVKVIKELPDEYTQKDVKTSKDFLYKLLIKYRV
ncbi:MAG: SPOR domain-containing protein [Clostridium sp.]|uniref:SPOR domain-containing protein n=1 Tax=Clostridium sp. TaxID=1506 RepID=UPI00290B7788|nr:SPOR domain-containing protein [Clostridium sp.]MDU5742155.1 SPOR domain-containing protein [Clostridium sp.]MDU5784130.1 SPOR domain-containing protein [Clostridium sp.]